jgi:hypothetical protein
MTDRMRGDGGGEDEGGLPDGVIPLRREPPPSRWTGCGVTGCLGSVTVLFAILLIALLIGLAVRMWITPAMPRM